MLSAALLLTAGATAVVAQGGLTYEGFTPLVVKRFDYEDLPYQVDTDNGIRGRQTGYNRCNSTTAGPESLCQTAIVNSLDDFCLWAPPRPGDVVGNIEGEMVAWCTKGDLHGARQIPAGALTGVQFMKTPRYVQVTGFITQELVNIAADDDGGEMDSAGADSRGNPLGGVLFSNAFGGNGSSVNGTGYVQSIRWHNFMGANVFCLKACDPTFEDDYRMCEHIYDRSGCNVNAPAAYRNGTFDSCLGDDQLPPGVYIENGQRRTWTQPGEGTPIGQLPYSVFTPASSSCTTYQSESIYITAAAQATSSASSSASSAASDSASSAASSAASGASGASNPVATAVPSQSGTASGVGAQVSAQPTSGAGQLMLPVIGAFAAIVFGAILVAM